MDFVKGKISGISRPRFEEDFVDRLNYKVISYMLLGAALAILAKEYGGEPIACWGRAEWPGGWLQYAHDFCFVENTYYIPLNMTVPKSSADRERHEINYYQWVPFILALMAAFFNIPHIFWRSINSCFGIDVRSIITMAESTKKMAKEADKNEARDSIVTHLADRFKLRDNVLARKKNRINALKSRDGYFDGMTTIRMTKRWFSKNFLGIMYLVTKLMFITNLLGQWIFIGHFLGNSTHFWAFKTLGALTRGETWSDTGHFPRVTICDFQIRQILNIHRHSVQCVLMANIFNEKIFLGLWYGLFLVLCITIVNTINWKYWLIFSNAREGFLEQLLMPSVNIVFPKKAFPEDYQTSLSPLAIRLMNKVNSLKDALKKVKMIDALQADPSINTGSKIEETYKKIELTEDEQRRTELTDEEEEKLAKRYREESKKMAKAWKRLDRNKDLLTDDQKKRLVKEFYVQEKLTDEERGVDLTSHEWDECKEFLKTAFRLNVTWEDWELVGIPKYDLNEMSKDEQKEVDEWHGKKAADEKERQRMADEVNKNIVCRRNYKKIVRYYREAFSNYVGADGILIFRLMNKNAGSYITAAVVSLVFKKFAEEKGIHFTGKDENGNDLSDENDDDDPPQVVTHHHGRQQRF